jgi:hypothetical protein
MEEVGHGLLSEGERRFLLALNDLGVRYQIVGMSAALLQGARGAEGWEMNDGAVAALLRGAVHAQ